MLRADIVTQKLTGPFFPDSLLRIKQFTTVKYVTRVSSRAWKDLDQPSLPSSIVLTIPSLDIISPVLGPKDVFLVDFPTPGVFTVNCPQLPGMTQKVLVIEESDFPELESDSNETISVESGRANRRQSPVPSSMVWAKRPRTRKRTAFSKTTVLGKDTQTSSGSNSTRFKKSQKTNSPSISDKVGQFSDKNASENAVRNPQTSNSVGLTSPVNSQVDLTVQLEGVNRSEDIVMAEMEVEEGDEVVEWIQFSGLTSESVVNVLADLKRKYQVNNEICQTNILFCDSFEAFEGWIDQLVCQFSGEAAVPKGQSNRRVRRSQLRMDDRIRQ